MQTTHARRGIEYRAPLQAGVDHDVDAIDGEAGFGDVRGQHDLALPRGRRRNGTLLLRQGQASQQGVDLGVRWRVQGFRYAVDFALAGKEHQDAAVGVAFQGTVNGPQHLLIEALPG